VCCLWFCLEQVWRIECAEFCFVVCVCVCLFVCVCVCVIVCAACGTFWSMFVGVIVQQVALCCRCDFAACGTVWSRFGGVSV